MLECENENYESIVLFYIHFHGNFAFFRIYSEFPTDVEIVIFAKLDV